MTQRYLMHEKKIELKKENRAIVAAYSEAINEHEVVRAAYKDMKEAVNPSTTQALLRKIDHFFGTNIAEAATINLREVNEKLDPSAIEVLEDYRDFFYRLLENIGKYSDDTEATNIDSRFVLISELFIRLAASALSTDMNFENDGDLIIKIMKSFHEKIAKLGVLENQSIVQDLKRRDIGEFNTQFSVEHLGKLALLEKIITVIKLLRAPDNAFALMVDYVHQASLLLMRQTVARIDSKSLISMREKDFASNRIHAAYLKKIATVKLNDPAQKKIKELHDLYAHTSWLMKYIGKYDLVSVAFNWVLIINGKLNIEELHKLIICHTKLIKDHLTLDASDPVFKGNHGKALRVYSAATTDAVTVASDNALKKLKELSDTNTLKALSDCLQTITIDIRELRALAPSEFKTILESNKDEQSVELDAIVKISEMTNKLAEQDEIIDEAAAKISKMAIALAQQDDIAEDAAAKIVLMTEELITQNNLIDQKDGIIETFTTARQTSAERLLKTPLAPNQTLALLASLLAKMGQPLENSSDLYTKCTTKKFVTSSEHVTNTARMLNELSVKLKK